MSRDTQRVATNQNSFSSFFTRSNSNDLLRKTDLSCLTSNLHTVWLIQPSRRNILPKSFHTICRVNQMDIRLNRMTIIQQQSSFSGTDEGTFYHTSGWKSLKAIHWIEFSLSYLKRSFSKDKPSAKFRTWHPGARTTALFTGKGQLVSHSESFMLDHHT